MVRRGEIFYIMSGTQSTGCEQKADRPAIIVSNNKCNIFSKFVEVVYLTKQPKTDLPTHVTINSSGRTSTALCEQVHSVSIDRVGDYVGICTDYEIYMIDIALAVSLGLDFEKQTDNIDKTVKALPPPSEKLPDEILIKISAERDLYKNLYENLLGRLIK